MPEEWLAAWDAATEADRRAVLERVSDGRYTFVIAARQEADQLIAATCSLGNGRIALDEIVVERGVVEHEERFHEASVTRFDAPEPEARAITERILIGYPAWSQIRARTVAECEERTLGSWLSKAPQVRVLAVVPDGARHRVTIVGTYVIWHSTQSTEWGVQYFAFDELLVDGAAIETVRRRDETVDIANSELDTHDHVATTERVVAAYLARSS